MPHDVIAVCPVCSSDLAVTRLHCNTCGTSLDGEFTVGRFGRLSRDQLALLESFLRSRGNLREMERELGLSYPTVRSRVESLVRALGFEDASSRVVADDDRGVGPDEDGESDGPPSDQAAERQQILERLARHEISADDAATAIRGLRRN